MADVKSFGDDLWQTLFKRVFAENELLVGIAFAFNNHHRRRNPELYALFLDPDHTLLAKSLIDESNGMIELEILEGNTFSVDLIQSRGYARSNDFMVMREKPLANTPQEPVNLPQGHSIRQAPSNIDELHLNGSIGRIKLPPSVPSG